MLPVYFIHTYVHTYVHTYTTIVKELLLCIYIPTKRTGGNALNTMKILNPSSRVLRVLW